MSLLGDQGLMSVANKCHENTLALIAAATRIEGVSRKFTTPIFHEVVLKLPIPAAQVLDNMAEARILGGFDLSTLNDSNLTDCILVNATETKTTEDIELFASSLASACGGPLC
jgi:glycine dehydrogenase subunit 1